MRVRLPSRSFGCLFGRLFGRLFESLTPRRNRDPSGTFDVLAQLGRGAGSRCRMLRVRIPRTSLLGLVAQRKRPPTQTRRGVGSSPTQVIPARARIYWRHSASSPNWQGRRLMSAVVQVRILSKPLARPSRGLRCCSHIATLLHARARLGILGCFRERSGSARVSAAPRLAGGPVGQEKAWHQDFPDHRRQGSWR